MDGEGDVHVRLRTATVVLDRPFGRHFDQVPLAVGDEAADVTALWCLLHQVQLKNGNIGTVNRGKLHN